MKKIIIITGETATGKTKFALQKAHEENGELINVDSRQIYKYLDLITGKDLTDHSFQKISTLENFDIGFYNILSAHISSRIWLYDITTPDNYFSAFDFQLCALPIIKDILSRGKTPILVGGTYFYLHYLLYNKSTKKIEPDWGLRSALEKLSVDDLKSMLKELNSDALNSLNQSDVNNPRRLMRQIELAKSQETIESIDMENILLPNKISETNLVIEYIGFHHESKDVLDTKITMRVQERIKQGAIGEVESLLKRGYKSTDPGLQTIGYQQIISYINNKITKEEAITQWITKEKQYAKRQYTFMKKDPHIKWEITC